MKRLTQSVNLIQLEALLVILTGLMMLAKIIPIGYKKYAITGWSGLITNILEKYANALAVI